jgi:high-affinity iron transporter
VLANYLIGLREGLEAALIVAILVAYLVKLDRREVLPRLWAGVGAAAAVSVIAALLLQFASETLSEQAAEAFAGIMSLFAVALITWMIFWMAKHARKLKAHLHGEVDRSLETGTWALAIVAFLAVVREGLETALFLWTGITAVGGASTAVSGALLGLVTAVIIGFIVYRGMVRLNMSRLFTWTGAALVIVAAGILTYAVHEFQELGWLPGEDATAFDVSGTIAPDSVAGTVLRGAVNFRPVMNWVEIAFWLAYVVPTMTLYLRVVNRRSTPVAAPAETPEKTPVAS